MSPWPGRSTLITSAPNHASSWVQVGPDWTWVKSRTFTPWSALPSWPHGFFEIFGALLPLLFLAITLSAGFFTSLAFIFTLEAAAFDVFRPGAFFAIFFAILVLLLLLQLGLRIEIADAAALAAGGGIDYRVDQRGLASIHRRVDGALQLVGRRGVDAGAAERFHHLVVACALDEHGRRRVVAGLVGVGAAIDAVVVEHDDADGEVVAADRFDLHAGEAEGAVALDRQHRMTGLDRGGDRLAHADTHHSPGADVEPLARLVHVDHAARQVERVRTLVDQDRVGPLLDDGAQHAERAVIIHRVVVVHETRRHLGDVLLALGRDRAGPVRRRLGPAVAHAVEQRGDARADVADHRRGDLDVAVHLLGLDVDLNELLRCIAPGAALAVAQQPVEAGADHHHDVGVLQHRRARRTGALRMGIGQQALGHAHRQERHARLLDKRLDGVVGLRVGRALAEDDQRLLCRLQHIERAADRGGRGELRRRGV